MYLNFKLHIFKALYVLCPFKEKIVSTMFFVFFKLSISFIGQCDSFVHSPWFCLTQVHKRIYDVTKQVKGEWRWHHQTIHCQLPSGHCFVFVKPLEMSKEGADVKHANFKIKWQDLFILNTQNSKICPHKITWLHKVKLNFNVIFFLKKKEK